MKSYKALLIHKIKKKIFFDSRSPKRKKICNWRFWFYTKQSIGRLLPRKLLHTQTRTTLAQLWSDTLYRCPKCKHLTHDPNHLFNCTIDLWRKSMKSSTNLQPIDLWRKLIESSTDLWPIDKTNRGHPIPRITYVSSEYQWNNVQENILRQQQNCYNNKTSID